MLVTISPGFHQQVFLAFLCAQHILLHNGRENTQPKIAFETEQQAFHSYSLLELLFFE